MCLRRTAHRNVGQMQDLYLPTNALAALANLAPQVSLQQCCCTKGSVNRPTLHKRVLDDCMIEQEHRQGSCANPSISSVCMHGVHWLGDMAHWTHPLQVKQHQCLLAELHCMHACPPPQVTGLHSHAAQRLVGLTSSMARHWLKLTQAAETALQPPSTDVQVSTHSINPGVGSRR